MTASFCYLFSFFNKSLPALNLTLIRGAIGQAAPVRGFRPIRGLCGQSLKEPKPCRVIPFIQFFPHSFHHRLYHLPADNLLASRLPCR